MSTFFTWEGWNAISSICQLFIAMFAFIAICITVRQISSKSKLKLNMKLNFGLGIYQHNNESKVVPGISISIANLGMAPVYISSCGIEFVHNKSSNPGLFITDEPFVLQSGECVTKSMIHPDAFFEELDNEVSFHDKARIYVVSGTEKIFYKKTDFDYASFKFEFQKVNKKVMESNNSNGE